MQLQSTKDDKQKSLIIATLLFLSIFVILFFIRFWPPSNIAELVGGGGGGGVEINFGNSDMGMGDNFESKNLDIQNNSKPSQAAEADDENIISEDNSTETAVVVPKKDIVKKTKIVVKKEDKPTVITKPKVVTNSALNNILKGAKNGDGNTKTKGNQGKNNGKITSNGYDLDGDGEGGGKEKGKGKGIGDNDGDGKGKNNGKGTGSGYSLNGRKALSKPKPDSSCSNDTGNVVVEVTVDKNGNTINAVVGKRGTTVTAKCLKDQAKQAAMATKWATSPEGTEQQVGEIIYSFGLN